MIPKLRRKFISITAAALFTVILLVIATINFVFMFQTSRILDLRLDRVMNATISGTPTPENTIPHADEPLPPQTALHGFHENDPHRFPDNATDFPRPFDMNLRIRFDGCLIYLNTDGTIRELKQDMAEHYTQNELQDIVADIFQKGKDSGWIQYFKYHMETRTAPDGTPETKIGLINASSDLYSICNVLIISLVIGSLSFLLVLIIIILASRKAVRPMEESYLRQKQFVTDAGHELKTPLTVISANNELSRMIYGDSEWFDSIDNQVTKMNRLIGSLITLARMDEEQSPVFAPFNLSDAVYDTAKSFEHLIHAKGKLLTFDIEDDIIYSGDESKIRQTISILMDNAAKYCDKKGKIAVKLTAKKQICLQVINDYTQALDCDLNRVFERFYRADKARTPDGSYGLGLSIAKSIVELHKGKIYARRMEHGRIMFEIILMNTPAR